MPDPAEPFHIGRSDEVGLHPTMLLVSARRGGVRVVINESWPLWAVATLSGYGSTTRVHYEAQTTGMLAEEARMPPKPRESAMKRTVSLAVKGVVGAHICSADTTLDVALRSMTGDVEDYDWEEVYGMYVEGISFIITVYDN